MSLLAVSQVRNRQLNVVFSQGLRHADENGGDGDQAAANPGFSSEATHTKNRNLSGFGPLFS